MKTQNRFFDVYPRIVPANRSTVISIKERYGQSRIKDGVEYEIKCYPVERITHEGEYILRDARYITAVNGTLKIGQFFAGEQEHIIVMQERGNESSDKILRFSLYSLEEDLFKRKPYKGDLHMHTNYSDGKESPGYVTASCRKIGLDFMAITDHGQYFPSIEAQNDFNDLDIDLLVCRGEEVHPINNPVHMINFGGSLSVNELISEKQEEYISEVKRIEEGLSDIKDEDARYQCASCLWCFDKIRKGGGLGIFCHPYWLISNGYYISDTVITYMLENQPYDALEVIGGYFKHEEDSNTLQVARYHEERAKGKKIPIVGVSDSHGCENSELFGWYYTIAFSAELGQKDIIGSIKDLYSVAVEAIPGEAKRAYGPFRLVKYAMFLMKEILPEHDELCFEEGRLMMSYLSGEKSTAQKLEEVKGRTKSLYDKLWA